MRAELITFAGGKRELEGYLVFPDKPQPSPAVIVVHEIWGVDDHIKGVARRFAQEGYVALAPDLYSGEWRDAMKPDKIMAGMMVLRDAPPEVQRDPARMAEVLATRSPEEQKALQTLMRIMSSQQRQTFAEELVGASQYLATRPEVDADRITSMGFCMGGGLAIHMATKTPDLWKTVIFYGENPPLDQVPAINAKVFGIYAGKDRRITDLIPEFQKAMEESGKAFTYKVEGGTQHAFFNDTRPMYNKEAAEDAWQEVLRFLAKE